MVSTCNACVSVINVAAIGPAIVPILSMFVGSGRTSGLLCASPVATKPGWLLWDNTAAIAIASTTAALTSAIASTVAIVGCVLLMWGGIDAGWGLLADSHAELLDVC